MAHRLVAFLTVAAFLAGCAQPPAQDPSDDGLPAFQRLAIPGDPMPDGPGHDHADPAQHQFLWHYELVHHDPLLQNQANIAGLHALDMEAGYLFGAVWGSHAASVDGGLVIWDLADPLKPLEVGRWTIPGSVGGDRSVAATSAGDYVILTAEGLTCAGHVNPLGAAVGAWLLDVRDKTEPKVADVLLNPRGQSTGTLLDGSTGSNGTERGQHSVTIANIGGTDHAFIFGKVYRIDRTEEGARLVHVRDMARTHDIFVRDTPWGTTWGFAAEEDKLTVYNLTDPADPQAIGLWHLLEGESSRDEGVRYYFHTADAFFLDDGAGGTRTIVLQSSEDSGPHTSPFWVLDGDAMRDVQRGAEPARLDLLGEWHNPSARGAGELLFSMHNPRLHDGLATFSHYHGGLWQFDFRHPETWTEPAPIAYAVLASGEPTLMADPVEGAIAQAVCKIGKGLASPTTVDQEIGPGGIIYAADSFAGLQVFRPTADHPVYGSAIVSQQP